MVPFLRIASNYGTPDLCGTGFMFDGEKDEITLARLSCQTESSYQ
jgi:hypothetical protein